MDVGGWLRSLGLGQCEASFRDNKIDTDVLPQLTADDFKDIGVSASEIGVGCWPQSPPCLPQRLLRTRPRQPRALRFLRSAARSQ